MRLASILFSKIPKNFNFSNYPERYIRKQTQFIEWITPAQVNYQPRVTRYRKKPYYDLHRPWTNEFQDQNAPNVEHPPIFIEPIRDWNIYVGDMVQILRGRDKGKTGVVNYVVRERNWVCVKGLNLRYSLRKREHHYPGTMIAEEAPLLFPRDVSLVDPEDREPTQVEWRLDEEGNQVRVSLRTGRIIPIPARALETRDYTIRRAYKEQPKDTPESEVTKATFMPKLKTFEMDIADEMGIKEDRIPYPTFWY